MEAQSEIQPGLSIKESVAVLSANIQNPYGIHNIYKTGLTHRLPGWKQKNVNVKLHVTGH